MLWSASVSAFPQYGYQQQSQVYQQYPSQQPGYAQVGLNQAYNPGYAQGGYNQQQAYSQAYYQGYNQGYSQEFNREHENDNHHHHHY